MALLKTAATFLVLIGFSLSYSQSDTSAQKTGDTVGKTNSVSVSFEEKAKSAQTLFTVGSIMALTGCSIILFSSDRGDMVSALGTTLVLIGHGGMIMTGISTNMMEKAVHDKYPKKDFDFNPTSGWVYYGSGLGLEVAGFTCIIIAAKTDNDLLGFSGVIGVVAGEVVSKLSWFAFNENMKYWKNMFQNVSLLPQFRIEQNGRNRYGSVLSFKF